MEPPPQGEPPGPSEGGFPGAKARSKLLTVKAYLGPLGLNFGGL